LDVKKRLDRAGESALIPTRRNIAQREAFCVLRTWLTTISVTMLPSPASAGEGEGVRVELC
jgi:hypothetical protein